MNLGNMVKVKTKVEDKPKPGEKKEKQLKQEKKSETKDSKVAKAPKPGDNMVMMQALGGFLIVLGIIFIGIAIFTWA